MSESTETVDYITCTRRGPDSSSVRRPSVALPAKPHLTAPYHLKRQPVSPPPFTQDDLRAAIADLFEKPWYVSFGHLALDLIIVSGWFFLHLFIMKWALVAATAVGTQFQLDLTPLEPFAKAWTPFNFTDIAANNWIQILSQSANAVFSAPLTAALQSPVLAVYSAVLIYGAWQYCYFQSSFFTGLLIIGHECGHGGFLDNRVVCDVVGWVLHSFLLIPYFSWKFSHRNHHSHNKNQAYDEAHMLPHLDSLMPSVSRRHGPDLHPSVPKPQVAPFLASFKAFAGEVHHHAVEFSFAYRVFYYSLYCTIGYILYLFINAAGREYAKSLIPPNHFLPTSPVFKPGEGKFVLLSDLGLVIVLSGVYYSYLTLGLSFTALMYIIPYFGCQFYFIMYTLGHHACPALPTYSNARWTYLMGALSTIDRNHGAFHNWAWHHISDTHVVHHIFSSLPFYNAQEATERLKPILGDYYMHTEEDNVWFGTFRSMWRQIRDGTFIAEDDHPGLVLAAVALETSKKHNVPLDHPTVEKAVKAAHDIALENDPHKNGRNVDAEVFWPRTLQL